MLRTLVRAAYARWVPLIGREPRPMVDDYAARIAARQAYVLDGATPATLLGVVILEDAPDALVLDNVSLAPEAQGRRLGHALIAFAEDEARRRGYSRLRLFTNAAMEANIALYTKLGFVETTRSGEGSFRRVDMAKQLD